MEPNTDFSIDWPHGHSILGYPARILATDMPGNHPIIAAYMPDHDVSMRVNAYTNAGRLNLHSASAWDIKNNPPPPPRETWVNWYACGSVSAYASRERADKGAKMLGAHTKRIACVKITEGEGL